MDVSFALITEGITDQVALKAVLTGHYNRFNPDIEVFCNPVQPTADATDASKQGGFAGWELVLQKCAKAGEAEDALALNDFLIVQIDTDMGDHVNYGLPLAPGGVDVDEATLVEQARAIIATKFGDRWPAIQNRVFLAISVHSLECWLLALHVAEAPCATKSCENRLEKHLRKQDQPFEKTYRCYEAISKGFRKPKELEAARQRSVSLNRFVDSLPVVQAE
ncbi:hypothetical protein [Stenotrophomonas sp.]|uniref:hypothetical protein n=1 Tax=Stenotrophomonas sp. TaxID=69392 RepID=UPI0028ABAA86|nr:hypothetical protein [Stenotrophomonas sp.]